MLLFLFIDHSYVALVTLNGSLTRLSIQLRLNLPTTPSPINTPDVMSTSVSRDEDLDEGQQPELFCEVATMSAPKCGLGVAELGGKLLVCGGYDRAECLRSVEVYCPETNSWTQQSNMGEARGRVQIAVIDGIVYAVGGCNGTTELDSVEYLSKLDKKWKKMCKLPLARSNAGVCALNGQIYCIGGWNGQSGIKQCDVLRPEDNRWTSIATLNTGRYQAGVTAYGGRLWVVGGSDAWNCLGSVEVYDPEANQWTYGASLLTARYEAWLPNRQQVAFLHIHLRIDFPLSVLDVAAVWRSSMASCTRSVVAMVRIRSTPPNATTRKANAGSLARI